VILRKCMLSELYSCICSPNEVRSQAKRAGGAKYNSRVVQAEKYKRRVEEKPMVQPNPLDDVFGNRLA
jgi:hypothetical protein